MNRDALIVGINRYSDPIKSLTSPAKDAEAIAQLLEKYGDFDTIKRLPVTREQKIVPVKPVSLNQLREALKDFFMPNSQNIPDTALFFFAGHGWRDKTGLEEGYLATSDVNFENGNFGLSLEWLRKILQKSKIKQQIVWLDCCHSGGECFVFDEANPGMEQGRARCFIAASREHERAYQQNDATHGILTAALLKGLDPKLNGVVNNHKLADFVSHELKSVITQEPVYLNTGKIILTPNAKDTATPVVTPIQTEINAYNAYLDNILTDAEELDKRYIDLSAKTESKTVPPPTQWARDIIPPSFRVIDQKINPVSEESKLLDAISEALELHECFVLLGAPGAGKTITLKKLQLDSAKLARQNPEARIPILINLALWHDDIVDLQQFLNIQLQALPFVPLNRALILLDGLNEMPSKKYVQRVQMLEKWLQDNPKLSIIIGCRKQHYQQSKKLPLPTVQIEPFDNKRIQLFLQAYLGSEATTQLLSQLGSLDQQQRSARDLINLANNPYLLFMICYVYTQNQGQLPNSRGQLFQLFVQVLYKREQEKGTTEGINYQDFVLGLSEMAFAMQRHRSSTSVHTAWAAKQIPARLSVDALWRLGREASLLNFLKGERVVQFTHQLILEYLAAEGLLKRYADLSKYIKKTAFFRNKRGSGAWDEVIYTLIGITDANQFLVQLAEIDPFLAMDCFEHVPQEVEVTNETRHFITRQIINLLGSTNPQARESAILKVVQLGNITVSYLIDLLGQGNKVAKRASLKALAQFDDNPLATKTIILALENSNKWVRKDAQAILERIKPSKFEYLAQEQDENVVFILEKHGYVSSVDALPEQDNIWMIFDDIENIKKAESLSEVDKLIPYLQNNAPSVRAYTINALAKLGDAQIVDKIIPCLQDDASYVRNSAINTLAKLGDASIVDKIIPYLQDKFSSVRNSAINALAKLGDAQIVDKIIPYLQDKIPSVRNSAINAIAKLGDSSIVDQLIPCLQDEASNVRGSTITALAKVGDVSIVDQLIPCLQDETSYVRSATITALAKLDAQIGEKLIPYLQDEDSIVRNSASTALRNLGYDPNKSLNF